jgi:hypothetical protein
MFLCPDKSIGPVRAITGRVARTIDADAILISLKKFLNLSSQSRTGSHLSMKSDIDDKPKNVEKSEGKK